MIWRELWQWALVVVLARRRWQKQVSKLASSYEDGRRQRHHGWPRSNQRGTLRCACASCVEEFAHFDAWVEVA